VEGKYSYFIEAVRIQLISREALEYKEVEVSKEVNKKS